MSRQAVLCLYGSESRQAVFCSHGSGDKPFGRPHPCFGTSPSFCGGFDILRQGGVLGTLSSTQLLFHVGGGSTRFRGMTSLENAHDASRVLEPKQQHEDHVQVGMRSVRKITFKNSLRFTS